MKHIKYKLSQNFLIINVLEKISKIIRRYGSRRIIFCKDPKYSVEHAIGGRHEQDESNAFPTRGSLGTKVTGAIAIELPFAAGCRRSKNFGSVCGWREGLARASVFLRCTENKYVERIGQSRLTLNYK